ncbi:MAG TPA: hypothetical protein VG295_03205, partial [Solirubrobacteraceae bacterium]|nr:hypothetical protein [Solirubrobacteraceae bacterium]
LAANPDHDAYGGAPWSYNAGPMSGSIDPSTFARLPTFSVSGKGLATWSESSSGTAPLVGINPTTRSVTDLSATVPPGQIFVEPGSASQVVAVGWTSPFSQPQTVSIDGSITSDAPGPGPCIYATTWSVDQNGVPLPGASGTLPGPFSTTATIPPGGSIYLTAATPPAHAGCDATGLQLAIQDSSPPAPPVTLTTPAGGSSTTITEPTFAGGAGADFGDSGQVTLRLYSGHGASGTAVRTVTVPRSGATWSTTLTSPLPLGTYTAQAQQNDIASPADAGLSAPVTFAVTAPSIILDTLGARPLTTSTPTLTGVADSDAGSDPFAVVEVFRGTTVTGPLALRLTTAVAPAGQFSVQLAPALADGTYTAQAAQVSTAGATGYSPPETFSIDTHPPPVTILTPRGGSRSNPLQLVFTGTAGDESFYTHVVSVALYRGRRATGLRFGTSAVKVRGSTWSATWPRTLAPGFYTAQASQSDAVGHVGVSLPTTFRVLPLPPVVAGVATINGAGHVAVKVACNEPMGDSCAGTVVVLTRGDFQPVPGGPVGRLTVMFAYVHIPGGQIQTVTRMALPSVAAVLRRHPNVAVTISANLHPSKGKAIHALTRGRLRRTGA